MEYEVYWNFFKAMNNSDPEPIFSVLHKKIYYSVLLIDFPADLFHFLTRFACQKKAQIDLE